MSVTTVTAPARSDLAATATPVVPASLARKVGIGVAAGTLSWVAGILTVGANPTDSLGISIADLSAVPFQLGLFGLVYLQLKTRATGTSKVARGMLRGEFGLLTIATLWSVLHGAVPAFRDDLWLGIMDLFWPLSMLGMFIIGVKILFTARWRGVARVWPIIAESWAVVCVPAIGILGNGTASDLIAAGHLLVGYTTLGLILAVRPLLTGARS